MSLIHAQILTPDGPKFEGDVDAVQVPGVLGSFEVRFNHAPIVSSLEIGQIKVTVNKIPQYFTISGGFVELNDNKLTLIAESAEAKDDIDVERAKAAKERAKERISDKNMDTERAKLALARAENRLKMVLASK